MGHPGLDVRTLQKSKSLFNINLIGFRYTLELTVLVIFSADLGNVSSRILQRK